MGSRLRKERWSWRDLNASKVKQIVSFLRPPQDQANLSRNIFHENASFTRYSRRAIRMGHPVYIIYIYIYTCVYIYVYIYLIYVQISNFYSYNMQYVLSIIIS